MWGIAWKNADGRGGTSPDIAAEVGSNVLHCGDS
jgi:hypothetical protein